MTPGDAAATLHGMGVFESGRAGRSNRSDQADRSDRSGQADRSGRADGDGATCEIHAISMDDVDGIGDELVRSLLREQHPDLADLGIRTAATGWDNRMWRLGDTLAVRLPRTPRAPALLRREQRWLPELTPRLPLPVPDVVRVGEPSALFPRPWSVTAWVPGEPADRLPVTRGPHAAERLAGFLRALHRPAPHDAPSNPTRGIPLGALRDAFDGALEAAAPAPVPAGVRDVWDDALSAPPWQGPPVWLHGDLHPANAVVSSGTLHGVIDFGELCAGDPATDLSAAWLLLPAGTSARCLDAYGRPDDATVRRARGWAVLRGLHLVSIGLAGERGLPGGKLTWRGAGRATLERVLASG